MPREVQLTEKQVVERDRFRMVHVALCSMAIFERLYASVLTMTDQDDLPYLDALAERVPFRTSVDCA